MSLTTGLTWTYKDIKLTGYSMAGISTSLSFPAANVCFDVAQGLPFQIPVTNFLITHGHMDHASGLPYLIGQRTMRGLPPAEVYMPEALLAPMHEIMKLWSRIEDHTFVYNFHTVNPGEERPLKAPFFFKTFPTYHRVPSQGYTVFQRKKRLKAEYKELPQAELGALRRQGQMIEEPFDEPVVSFTGDTRIEFLSSPQVRQSRVLVMEVTYWDERKGVENAREWGHIHFDELLPRLDEIKSEKILLIHTSARYPLKVLNRILWERVPEHHKRRIEIFPRPD